MFKRLRNLKISLAAKCQLLFGAAVVLIIAAALFVPWWRMEQLTEEVNSTFARGQFDYAVLQHLVEVGAFDHPAAPAGPATLPATRPGEAEDEAQPATRPAQTVAVSTIPTTAPAPAPTTAPAEGRGPTPPRLILFKHPNAGRKLTRFEQEAMAQLLEDPAEETVAKTRETRDGQITFRYARVLYAETRCMACHAQDVMERPAATQPARSRRTATMPAPAVLGMVSIDVPSQVEASEVRLNRTFIFVAGLLAGILAIIVFYLITTRLILQPVRVLQETAEKVSQGDLNIRSDISTGDEFQQLSETFNRMLVNLKAGEDQLRAINKSLDLKLEQLAESNVALYESNRLKTEFLANVSHELRTPLNSILGFAELLKDTSSDTKAGRYVQNILASGKNLLDLINDLLDLAKIEAGRMEVRSEPLSLGDLFEGLTSILKPLAERKELSVTVTVAPSVPILYTDPAKLQQVLYNFLSNAIKFSPPRAPISLQAVRSGDETVKISVSDEGPGIEPEMHSVIFEKFRQIDGSVTREHGGTGLGLAISRELTTLLGGRIGVESNPGAGATFWVELPLRIEAGAQSVRTAVAATANSDPAPALGGPARS